MVDDDLPRLNCTEQEFITAFRMQGFLSPFVEEAVPAYVHQHAEWFAHAEALNRAGLDALTRRDNEVVGLSSQHPVALAIRMAHRSLCAFQGAVILYRRGMIAEGDTLTRSVYETAFWLGFVHEDKDAASRAFLNDERKSQKARASYYLERFEEGAYARNSETEAHLKALIAELEIKISNAYNVSLRDVAKRSGLYGYYDAYKHLSAGSAHNSLNSLHRYLNHKEDGSYDGHIVGPDSDALVDALPVLCIGLGVALAMFCSIVAIDAREDELRSLLIRTDSLRKARKVAGGGIATTV